MRSRFEPDLAIQERSDAAASSVAGSVLKCGIVSEPGQIWVNLAGQA